MGNALVRSFEFALFIPSKIVKQSVDHRCWKVEGEAESVTADICCMLFSVVLLSPIHIICMVVGGIVGFFFGLVESIIKPCFGD